MLAVVSALAGLALLGVLWVSAGSCSILRHLLVAMAVAFVVQVQMFSHRCRPQGLLITGVDARIDGTKWRTGGYSVSASGPQEPDSEDHALQPERPAVRQPLRHVALRTLFSMSLSTHVGGGGVHCCLGGAREQAREGAKAGHGDAELQR
eukprot:8224785-Alexandrium_andersonii.AAC.1